MPSVIRLPARVASFAARLHWMAPLAGGPLHAARLLVRLHRDPATMQSVQYAGHPLRFRGTDEQALREVLADQEYAFLEPALRRAPAPSILDVGAHVGTFALWCLSVQPAARIVSVEADPATFAVLEANTVLRGLPDGQWSCRWRAAAAVDGGTVRLCTDGPSMSHRAGADGGVEVPGISLASVIDAAAGPAGQVDFAKIDIEGSEAALILAAPHQLARIDQLIIELHPNLGDMVAVRAALTAAFPHVAEVGGRKSTKPLLYCTRDRPAING